MKIKFEYGKIKSVESLILCAERGKEIKERLELHGRVKERELELEPGVYWVYVLFWWRKRAYIVSKQVRVPKEKEVVLDLGEKRLYEFPDISKAEQEKILRIIEQAGFKGVSKEKDKSSVGVGMMPREIDEAVVLESVRVNREGGIAYYFSWWDSGDPEPEGPEQPEGEPHDDEPEEWLAGGFNYRLSAVGGKAPRCFERGKPIIRFPPRGLLSGKAFSLLVWGRGVGKPKRFNVTIGKQILPLKALIMELPEILEIIKGIGWAVNGLGIEN